MSANDGSGADTSRRRPRVKRSVLIALGIAGAFGLWFASAAIDRDAGGTPGPEKKAQAAQPVVTVMVATRTARSVAREIVVQGQTEPDRTVLVRAETDGQVAVIVAKRGARVTKGQIIARLKIDDREAKLREAEATVVQREVVYKSYTGLAKRGHQSANRVAEARAALEAARAALERIKLDIKNTVIRAPIDGYLNTRDIEIGDYLKTGDLVAKIVDIDPLVVAGQVPQQVVAQMKPGAKIAVRFVTGARAVGTIRYVATLADVSTRTFRIEANVPNPKAQIPAGLSAELRIVIARMSAHFISPATISLGDDGRLAVKTVGKDSRVRAYSVDIVRAETGGLWVAGLPKSARIIIRGQGFVREGDLVKAVERDGRSAETGTPQAAR
ncbi:MAG: efflux RND transporter periplasmic adaptor subunit [Alphaproteobacteria bacterium]|nr:efflux RND transporter periplasmic adaptor subunit [Alphaproteobacteria bacterium]